MKRNTARLSKRPGSVWNCLWGHALKRAPGINRKSRASYPGPGFLSSATWLPKKHYNGLIPPIFRIVTDGSHNTRCRYDAGVVGVGEIAVRRKLKIL